MISSASLKRSFRQESDPAENKRWLANEKQLQLGTRHAVCS